MTTEITGNYSTMLYHTIKRAHDQTSNQERVFVNIETGISIVGAQVNKFEKTSTLINAHSPSAHFIQNNVNLRQWLKEFRCKEIKYINSKDPKVTFKIIKPYQFFLQI